MLEKTKTQKKKAVVVSDRDEAIIELEKVRCVLKDAIKALDVPNDFYINPIWDTKDCQAQFQVEIDYGVTTLRPIRVVWHPYYADPKFRVEWNDTTQVRIYYENQRKRVQGIYINARKLLKIAKTEVEKINAKWS
jgi:hypothetical protein